MSKRLRLIKVLDEWKTYLSNEEFTKQNDTVINQHIENLITEIKKL